jgi:DNA-binding Lrp family transcriptional regulator
MPLTPPHARRNPRARREGSGQGARRSVDEVDRAIIALLVVDGRMPTSEVARRVGIPESTCAGRVRALIASGVIRGIHADVDLAALGRPMEAMIALRFTGHTRGPMDAFRDQIASVPGVIAAHHVSGGTDFLVHVSAASSDELRDLVLDHLTSLEGVAHAETSLIFERIPGTVPFP